MSRPGGGAMVGKGKSHRLWLRLYVTGRDPPGTARVVERVRELCKIHVREAYDLEIIDITRHPEEARREQICATPALVRVRPEPIRRFLGDLTNPDRLVTALRVRGQAGAR